MLLSPEDEWHSVSILFLTFADERHFQHGDTNHSFQYVLFFCFFFPSSGMLPSFAARHLTIKLGVEEDFFFQSFQLH